VSAVLAPLTIAEVSEIIATARHSSDALWFRGSGTSPTPDGHTVVSTDALKGVVDYKPDDLTIVVKAGTTLGELDTALSEHGHSAVLPETAANRTVGGVVASGSSGYRRLRYGPTRDRVIGVTLVTGYGEVVHAGGQLVKNVTGYDISRLMTGSHGALGFIAEISLKLWPLPASQRTIEVSDIISVRQKLYQPTAALETEHGGFAYVSGSRSSVDAQVAGLAGTVLDGFEWPEPFGETVVVAVNVAPRFVSEAVDRVRALGATRFVAQHGVGVVDVGWSDVEAGRIGELRAWAESNGGSVVIHRRGPLSEKITRWGAVAGTVSIQRRLKHLFDPDRVCNPGVLSRDV
jgi:glycolate oxidase FAD binding subunit